MENLTETPGQRLKYFIENDLKTTINECASYVSLTPKTVYNYTDGTTKLTAGKLKPFTDKWPINPEWVMKAIEPRLFSSITDKHLQKVTDCVECAKKDLLIADLRSIIRHYEIVISEKNDMLNFLKDINKR